MRAICPHLEDAVRRSDGCGRPTRVAEDRWNALAVYLCPSCAEREGIGGNDQTLHEGTGFERVFTLSKDIVCRACFEEWMSRFELTGWPISGACQHRGIRVDLFGGVAVGGAMGIDLVYVAEGRESRTFFSLVEWDTLRQIEPLLPDAMATVVGNAKLGETVSVPLNGLRAAIAQVVGLLSSQGDLLPFTYTFKGEYLLMNGQRFPYDEEFVTGMRSGLELPGDPGHWYTISAGLDECSLTKLAVGPDGRGRVVERRDLRSEHEVPTVTCGRIRIQKRRDHAGLRAEFAKISEFLESLAGPEVTRIVG